MKSFTTIVNSILTELQYSFPFIRKDKRPTIIYFRSAKTGSTSIIHAIKSSFIKSIEIKDYEDIKKISNRYKIIIVSVAAKPKTKLYKAILEALDEKIENRISFGVIRDPYSKIISSYKYLNFNETLNDLLVNLPSSESKYIHFSRSQTDAIYLDDKLIPNHLIKFENLEDEVRKFFRNNGYYIPRLKKLNSSRKTQLDLSSDLIENINKIYHQDFINFGYKKKAS